MLPAIKNFCIAFAVGLIIFGSVGFLLKPVVIDGIIDGFLSPSDNSSETGDGTNDGQLTDEQTSGKDTTPITNPIEGFDGESFTLLLIGSDYQPKVFSDYRINVETSYDAGVLAANQRHYGADTLVLIRFDVESRSCVISAIPTNLQVTVNGVSVSLYSVFETNGRSYLIELVQSITGLKIDYYLESNIETFKKIINLYGGVTYDVPVNMYYVDEEERIVADGQSTAPTQKKDSDGNLMFDEYGNPVLEYPGNPYTIDLKAGGKTLNGEESSQLLRFKAYSSGGQGARRATQAGFFKAMLDQYANESGSGKNKTILNYLSSIDAKMTNIDDNDDSKNAFLNMLAIYPKLKVVTIAFPCTSITADSVERASYTSETVYAAFAAYR